MPGGPEQHRFISYSSGSRKSKLQELPILFLVGVLFPVYSHSCLPAVSFHVGGGGVRGSKGRGASSLASLPVRALTPSQRATLVTSSNPDCLPKDPPLTPSCWGQGLQHVNLGRLDSVHSRLFVPSSSSLGHLASAHTCPSRLPWAVTLQAEAQQCPQPRQTC